jgi:dTDP-L-rhamnose 4-epimerase
MSRGNVLVTGGAGFIGSHLVDRLIELGFHVTVLDSLDSQVHGDEPVDSEGWPLYLNRECKRIRGDVQDPEIVRRALKGVTHLVHLAAAVGVGQSMSKIVHYTRVNNLGAATLLEELSRGNHQVQQMIVASSMSIYGEGAYKVPSGQIVTPHLRQLEQLQKRQWEMIDKGEVLESIPTPETKPLFPGSVYAVGKRDQEEMFLVVGRSLEIPTVALRFFNVYGSRQALSNPYTGVAAIFISRLMNNQSPLIFEDGQQRRDFVHVSDITRAITSVLDSQKRVWEAYNVGTGNWITIAQIAITLAKLMEKNIEPTILGKYRIGDVRHCYADTTKFHEHFNFQAQIPFEQGIVELVNWVTSQTAVDRTSESLAQLQAHKLLI